MSQNEERVMPELKHDVLAEKLGLLYFSVKILPPAQEEFQSDFGMRFHNKLFSRALRSKACFQAAGVNLLTTQISRGFSIL